MNKPAFLNRSFWIITFLTGFFIAAYIEWQHDQNGAMGWFLLTGIWSAACGIGFTICDWFIQR